MIRFDATHLLKINAAKKWCLFLSIMEFIIIDNCREFGSGVCHFLSLSEKAAKPHSQTIFTSTHCSVAFFPFSKAHLRALSEKVNS